MAVYKVQDPKLGQKNLIANYKTQFQTNITQAQNLVADNNDIVLKSDVLNEIGTIVGSDGNNMGMQADWFTNVIDELQIDQDTFTQWINNLMAPRNNYSSTQSYVKNNVVYDSTTKNFYLCIKDAPVGTVLTNTNYWLELPIVGDKGAIGLGVRWKDEWYSGGTYYQYDMVKVIDGGNTYLYVASVNITDKTTTPSQNSEWILTGVQSDATLHYVSSVSEMVDGVNILDNGNNTCTFGEYADNTFTPWNICTPYNNVILSKKTGYYINGDIDYKSALALMRSNNNL